MQITDFHKNISKVRFNGCTEKQQPGIKDMVRLRFHLISKHTAAHTEPHLPPESSLELRKGPGIQASLIGCACFLVLVEVIIFILYSISLHMTHTNETLHI